MENLWIAAYAQTNDGAKASEISERILGMLGLEE